MTGKHFFARYRRIIIAASVFLIFAMLLPLRQARINPDLMEYLPDDIESKVNLDSLESIFGHYDPLIVIFGAPDVLEQATLLRLRAINDSLLSYDGFEDVISIFESVYIRGEHGAMLVDPVVRRIPSTREQKEALREEIIDNPLAWKMLVSENFSYTLMLVNPGQDVPDDEMIEYISRLLENVPGDEEVWFGGLPYLRYEIQKLAMRDLAVLFPAGLIVMILFLYLSFRELRAVLLPFSVVCMSTAIAMGIIPLLGWDFSIIAVLIPIMMIAVANNYGVHIVARYQEINAREPGMEMKQIVDRVMAALTKPITLTALTTIFGILGLVVHVMLPARQTGIASAAGIAFALLFSLLYIPAVMSMLKKGKVHRSFTGNGKSVIDRLLAWSGQVTTRRTVTVILVFAAFLLISATGILRLKVSINTEEMMPANHPVRVSTEIANDNFGGVKHVSVLFEGDIRDPSVMTAMDRFGRELEDVRGVGGVTSLATIIRQISRALNDPGDEFYDTIPQSRAAIAQYIELYSMSGDPEDLEQLVDFDFTRAVLNVQFSADDIRDFKRITSVIDRMAAGTPWAVLQAGQSLVEKEMSQMIVRGQILSLVFAMAAIIILLWIIFGSAFAGLMGAVPLFFTLVCNFGLMGWAGFDLDIGNSLISSIAIGIGIDYTIHIFWRIKNEMAEGKDYRDAIVRSLATTGRGIAINAFSVMIGFSVLFFSGLVILKTFAFLIIFSLFLCLLCALILVPALCLIVRPAFLENSSRRTDYDRTDPISNN
ncbi:MAG: hypothetical protein EA408_12935 [Marinilabiliales bacterium]|nr:MAG: hypothetical protein EA408_12935 [Marinilabiliales bacterium]